MTDLHYVTSKAALIGFTRSLAREVGRDGICVNSVMPRRYQD
jgi:NAD(P)-dependent dehydrogenase (short-subunit alcohol dehydrogenase family)